jgi:hypothetical protein
VVLDPSRDGQAARVARWDFDLSAAREMLAASGGRGLKLELPWLATPPASQRLQVYVRYETADGRRLQTDREIFVTPPGQAIGRWTPRTESKRSAAAVKSEPALSPVATTAAKEPVTPPVWSPNREY